MKYRNGYSSHWERQFPCPRSLSYWRKWALHEERYILHVSYLKKKKNSLSRHWSTADYEARTIPVTLPYMVWRVWLTEILETFQRVFRFEKSRIKENGGKANDVNLISMARSSDFCFKTTYVCFVLTIDCTLLSVFCSWFVNLWKVVSHEPPYPLEIAAFEPPLPLGISNVSVFLWVS